MKHFESLMAEKLEEYITYRRHLGYSDKTLRSRLVPFDQYAKSKKADWNALDPSFFLKMRKDIKGESGTVNVTIYALRGFFRFLLRQEFFPENPLQDIPPLRGGAYIPFVFSPEQTDRLLIAIQKKLRKTEEYFLNDLAVYTVILLMAKCGLRISEPLRLLKTHYRPEEKTLYIEKTKFDKDRLIPVPKEAATEIENYLAVRNAFCLGEQSPILFAGQKQNRLTTYKISHAFRKAVTDIDLKQSRRIVADTVFSPPRPHSLRHSFAINTLKRIKQRGKSPQDALPILAVYMGHLDYRYTALYLKVLDAEQRQGLVDFALSRQEKR